MLAVLRPLVGRAGGEGPLGACEAEPGAVAAGLKRPRALQEHALACLVDPVVVGAGDDLDLPGVFRGDGWAAVQAHPPARRAVSSAKRQPLALLHRVAFHAADARHVEGGPRAQHRLRVDAAGGGEIGAGADAREAGFQHRAGGDGHALPLRYRFAVELRCHRGAGERDHGVALEAERRPEKLDLEPGGLGRIADQQVGEAEGPHVEGSRRRKALLPEAVAARKILHAGLQPGLDHLDHLGRPSLILVMAVPIRAIRDVGSWRGVCARSSCGQPLSVTTPRPRYNVAIAGRCHL